MRLGEILALTLSDVNDTMVKVTKNIKNVKINDKWTLLLQEPQKQKNQIVVSQFLKIYYQN
ncbi:protein of unknown function [Clostridium beijerinckii]|nr:protein of unknown function [Clostridium beijerinckii]